MTEFYFLLLLLLCAASLAVIILRPSKVYEFPFFMGCMFSVFLLPQAITLQLNPALVPPGSAPATLLMAVITLSMIYLGYYFCPPIRLPRFFVQPLDRNRLVLVTSLFTLAGYGFLVLINRQAADAPRGNWSGILTIYYTLYQIINLAFGIFVFLALQHRKPLYYFLALISALPILQQIIFSGRRESTSLFVLTIVLSLFFLKGKVIARVFIIAGLAFTLFMIPLIGNYRKNSDKDPIGAITKMNIREDFTRYYKEGKDMELMVASNMIDATDFYGSYDFGADYWNEMVFRYFPGQIFGKEMKASLMVGSHGQDKFYRQFNPLNGLTTTCVGDTFRHFGYFGGLFYFFLGGFFRSLWREARSGSFMACILYVISMVQSLLTVSHGTVNFLPGVFHMYVYAAIAIFFSKTSSKGL